MNILEITSSIRGKESISSKYADNIALKFSGNNNVLKKRDLSENPVPALDAKHLADLFSNNQTDYVKLSDSLVEEILNTDILILGSPMYNFSISAQLKNYIDAITRAGKTFRYTEKGPLGLTHIQKAYVIVSRGGFYTEGGFDSQEKYLSMILAFIGVKEVEFIFVEGLNMGDEIATKSLEKANNQLYGLNI